MPRFNRKRHYLAMDGKSGRRDAPNSLTELSLSQPIRRFVLREAQDA